MNNEILKEAITELKEYKFKVEDSLLDLLIFQQGISKEVNLDNLIYGDHVSKTINNLRILEKSIREYISGLERSFYKLD